MPASRISRAGGRSDLAGGRAPAATPMPASPPNNESSGVGIRSSAVQASARCSCPIRSQPCSGCRGRRRRRTGSRFRRTLRPRCARAIAGAQQRRGPASGRIAAASVSGSAVRRATSIAMSAGSKVRAARLLRDEARAGVTLAGLAGDAFAGDVAGRALAGALAGDAGTRALAGVTGTGALAGVTAAGCARLAGALAGVARAGHAGALAGVAAAGGTGACARVAGRARALAGVTAAGRTGLAGLRAGVGARRTAAGLARMRRTRVALGRGARDRARLLAGVGGDATVPHGLGVRRQEHRIALRCSRPLQREVPRCSRSSPNRRSRSKWSTGSPPPGCARRPGGVWRRGPHVSSATRGDDQVRHSSRRPR